MTLPIGLQRLICGICQLSFVVRVGCKRVVRELPWSVQMVRGQRKNKRWKREIWQLEVLPDFIHWCGLCWANVSLKHITETQSLEGGAVHRCEEPIYGTPHHNSDGRLDIKVTLTDHGQTYLHILLWYYYHNKDEYPSWKMFRYRCRQQKLDVDHGDAGAFSRHADGWRSYTDVHQLSLVPVGPNRSQGASLRKRYASEEHAFQAEKLSKRKCAIKIRHQRTIVMLRPAGPRAVVATASRHQHPSA